MGFLKQSHRYLPETLDRIAFFGVLERVCTGIPTYTYKNKKTERGIMDRLQTSEGIAAALRERIALARPDSDQSLPEGQLSKEFGVSRTPVRQALQRLEYERLITIRSGVGSMVVPLSVETRDQDISVACSLLTAAAECCGQERLPFQTSVLLSGHLGALSMVDEVDAAIFFKVYSQVLSTIVEIIPNNVLRDAFSAAYWRLIRWRVADFARAPHDQRAFFKDHLATVFVSVKQNRIEHVLRTIALAEQNWGTQTTSQVA